MLSKIRSETFKVEGRQEDAEEFLSCLLNGLHDEMIDIVKATNLPVGKSVQPGEIKPGTSDDEDWQVDIVMYSKLFCCMKSLWISDTSSELSLKISFF
jgi:hypothetical protein